MVAKAAEVAYLRNRAGDTPWDALSPQHQSEWREKVRPVVTAALAEMWRPIEEAPKDGTWVLVCEPSDVAPNVHVVRWGVPEWGGGNNTWVTMALGPNPDTYDVYDATHFMPLPAPPRGK